MKSIAYILTILIFLTSCEQVLFDDELETTDPKTNFDYFWNQVNENYSYFELKNVNWEDMRVKYEAGLYEGISEDSLFNLMANMLGELNDGHNNLVSSFNKSYSYVIYTGNDNYDQRIVYDNYLAGNEYETGPFSHSFIANGEVGYIRFPEFTGTVEEENLDFILDRYASTKGLIIDLRENYGGSPEDIFTILSRFTEQEVLVNYTQYKMTTTDHNSFSPPTPVYLKPFDGKRYDKEVMVLIDGETYSAGSFFSLATKAMNNVMLLGDTTGGGLGLPNGGQLPNGWTYRFSTTQALDLDMKADWEMGVPPDVFVEFDWNDRTKDEIIEKAIDEILN